MVKRKMVIFGSLLTLLIMILYLNNDFVLSNSTNSDNLTIEVLIYNGTGVMESSVDGIEDCLNESNNQNMSSHKFDYATNSIINSTTLSGYDVLIMPGGEAIDYFDNDEIDNASIKQFVSEGNGYIGICAGAYAASNYIIGDFQGWGLAPDVNTTTESYEGVLTISTTSFGTKLLNGTLTDIYMATGPAMTTNNNQIVMATYADNNTGYKNYPAIIGDTYGNGRVILSGPHPELDPQNPQLLTNMFLWASKKIDT
jgi:glutamine amidotransferase-like uncharacterized protein